MVTRPVTVLALLLVLVLPASGIMADTLWDQALVHAAPEDISPLVGMTMDSYQTNKAGEVTKTTSMEVSINPETGEMAIVSVIENDKDVTEKERKKAERQQNRGNGDQEDFLFIHPIFDPEKAEGLTLVPTGSTETVHGRECAVYEFRMEGDRKMGPGKPRHIVEEGHLYLDTENGMPLLLESVLVDGPSSIKHMTYTMEAFAGPEGRWRPGRIDMEFAAHLFIYMAGGVTMNFVYIDI